MSRLTPDEQTHSTECTSVTANITIGSAQRNAAAAAATTSTGDEVDLDELDQSVDS